MQLRQIARLDDWYRFDETGPLFITGLQALVRLLLAQSHRDRLAGLNTAGFVSGYRGSPLGGFDRELWRAGKYLDAAQIRFQPGLNEDLAATSIWGAQQANLFAGARYDGVFGMWYGKGPGVDRSGDPFKHGNAAGTSRYGGVLAVAGDDHTCKSSSLPHQSEYAFIDASMPVLNPADVEEIVELGLYRLRAVAVQRLLGRSQGHAGDGRRDAELRVAAASARDRDAASSSCRPAASTSAGRIRRTIKSSGCSATSCPPRSRSRARTRSIARSSTAATRGLGSSRRAKRTSTCCKRSRISASIATRAAEVGIKLFKVGMSWPLEPEAIRQFAEGLEEIVVIEEKRGVVENQLKEQLYNWQAKRRPLIVGKQDERGEWLLPSNGELTPALIARVLAKRMRRFHSSTGHRGARALPRAAGSAARGRRRRGAAPAALLLGLPAQHVDARAGRQPRRRRHRLSLHGGVDGPRHGHVHADGRRGRDLDRPSAVHRRPSTCFRTWATAPTRTPGTLAIRAAVAAGVNMTYKILFNDAVAMTGGQPVEGHLTVAGVAHQLVGEGVRADHRRDRRAGEVRGANGLAAVGRGAPPARARPLAARAARRNAACRRSSTTRRARRSCTANANAARVPTPDRRVVINELVCEGCGDCNVQSNCLSVMALETEFGRKRRINQSSCNQDFSCLEGFCPSFVTLQGAKRNPPRPLAAAALPSLPEPRAGAARRRAQRADRRRRRHRRRDGERLARSRGASRRQGGSASSIRPASRRNTAPCCRTCASRRTAERLARHANSGGASRSPARRRPDRRRGQGTAVDAVGRSLRGHRQHARRDAVGLHPRSRLRVSRRKRLLAALRAAGRPGARRGARCDAARLGAARRQHRRERADARLRVPARPAARVRRRAVSRARAVRPQRRREQARVRLGPVRRRESRAGRAARHREGRRAAGSRPRCPTRSRGARSFSSAIKIAPTRNAIARAWSASRPPSSAFGPAVRRCKKRSPATTSPCSPTRTSTRSRGCTRRAASSTA